MSSAGRRGLCLVIACAAALPCVSGPTAAQQGQEPHFDLIVTPGPIQIIREDLGKAVATFNVSVVPQQQLAINNQFRIVVRIQPTSQSHPNGWFVGNPDPQVRTVAPGERFQVNTTVELQLSSPKGDQVAIRYEVTSTPEFTSGGGALDPVLVQSLSRGDSEVVEVRVLRDLTTAEAVISFVRQFTGWLVLTTLGLIVVIALTLRKRRGGLVVSSDAPQQEVMPGRGASFPVVVRNEGNAKQVATLSTSEVPEGWAAILPLERVELGARDSQTIWLTVKAPENATPGQHVQVSFIVAAPDGTPSETLVEATVVEAYGSANRPALDATPSAAPPRPPRRR